MFLVQVSDQINPDDWCIVYTGEDEARARRIERALLDAGVEPERVEFGVGTLVLDTSDPSLTWDAAAAERAARAAD
jgi:hypothetical protein